MVIPDLMQAITLENYGGLEVLQYKRVPVPKIKDDQLLVKVHSAGVSPFDLHVRDGWYKDSSYYTFPIILGWEVSGIVVRCGHGSIRFHEGDAIFAYINAFHNGGGYAEFVAIKEEEAALKPPAISHDMAVRAASMNALTAWQALFDTAQLTAGQRILIHGGAGGVGHLAIQLAKLKGAYVITTASSKHKAFLLNLGVDEIIDYTQTPFEENVRNVDVVLDTIGGETLRKSFSVLKQGGTVVSIIDFEGIKEAAHHQVQGKTTIATPNAEQLLTIANLLKENKLQAYVGHHFSLKEAAQAHALLQAGHTQGKIVLNPGK